MALDFRVLAAFIAKETKAITYGLKEKYSKASPSVSIGGALALLIRITAFRTINITGMTMVRAVIY